jgi:ankyrin repeat protein
MELLLNKGANVNLQAHDGATALHWAAANGDEGQAQLLLDIGADAGVQTSNRETPVH